MCINNINAVIDLFGDISGEKQSRVFSGLFDSLSLKRNDDGRIVIKDINIVISFNLLASTNKDPFNIINNKGKLDCLVQFVNLDDTDNSIEVGRFTYNFSDRGEYKGSIQNGSRDYFSQKRIIKIEYMILPEDWNFGHYQFELLLKRSNSESGKSDNDWILQTFTELTIEEYNESLNKAVVSTEIL